MFLNEAIFSYRCRSIPIPTKPRSETSSFLFVSKALFIPKFAISLFGRPNSFISYYNEMSTNTSEPVQITPTNLKPTKPLWIFWLGVCSYPIKFFAGPIKFQTHIFAFLWKNKTNLEKLHKQFSKFPRFFVFFAILVL